MVEPISPPPPAVIGGRDSLRLLWRGWVWRMAWRDSRTQRRQLAVFALSIVLGISALVTIHALRHSLDRGIDLQARALLGSDLQVSLRQPFDPEILQSVAGLAEEFSREVAFSTMLYIPGSGEGRLVQLRGLEKGFPWYGQPETKPEGLWSELPDGGGILLEPTLLDQFDLRPGDEVRVGGLTLPVLGSIAQPAPRAGRFAGFAPEAYLSLEQVHATGLLDRTSLAFHHLHLKLGEAVDPLELREKLRALDPDLPWRFETQEDRRDQIGEALDLFQQFLGLIATAAIVLGAMGVAGGVHAHLRRRIPTVAILRCLGAPARLAFAVFLVQALSLGLFGALLGMTIGVGLHGLTVTLFRELIPFEVGLWPSATVIVRTTAAGFITCCAFAAIPLLQVRLISPLATLRRGFSLQARRGRWSTAVVYLILAALLFALSLLNAATPLQALAMTIGLGVAFGLLALTAAALKGLTRKLVRPSWPYLLRQGISNIHRPYNQTLLFLLSLGLGVFLVLTILLVRNQLLERLEWAQAEDSPNTYLVDVQPDQIDGVKALLNDQNLPLLESARMITMRIQSINGVGVRELRERSEIPGWILRRDFRSSYREHLNPTERIRFGNWHGPPTDETLVPLSLEEGIADDLGIGLGDRLTLDVQGVLIETEITSLRQVDWSRFNLNFFMLFPPGVLEEAPGFHVLTTRIAHDQTSGGLQRQLARDFPNVSAIDLALILDTIRGILAQVARVVQILTAFVVIAGVIILTGTLMNGREQRLSESALLRTLGASSSQIRTILWIEYATLGFLSCLTGLVLAVTANALFALRVFEVSPAPPFGPLALTLAAATLLAVAIGLLLGRGIANHPPLQILRR